MKRSSRIGLLISLFALIAASTMGFGSNSATQAQAQVTSAAFVKVVRWRPISANSVPFVDNWEEKRAMVDLYLQDYYHTME